jgi:NitT/TauT family transport system substrate-binding protein
VKTDVSRRFSRATAGFALVALLMAACSSGGSSASTSASASASSPASGSAAPSSGGNGGNLDKVTLRLDWFVNGNNSMYELGVKQGFYKEQGIDLTIGEGKGSSTTSQVVGSGSDMFGIADVTTAAQVAGKGAPITAVASFIRATPACITVLQSSGMSKPADIKGKKIGAPQASNATILLPAFLAANGMSESDIQTINVEPAATAQALVDGRIDGIADLTMSQAPNVAVQLGKPVNLIKYSDYGVSALSTGLIVNNDVLKSNPDLVKRMVAATVKSWKYAMDHPDEDIAITKGHNAQGNEEVFKLQLQRALDNVDTANSKSDPFGYMNQKDIDATVETLQKYMGQKSDWDAKSFFVNDYVPQS